MKSKERNKRGSAFPREGETPSPESLIEALEAYDRYCDALSIEETEEQYLEERESEEYDMAEKAKAYLEKAPAGKSYYVVYDAKAKAIIQII